MDEDQDLTKSPNQHEQNVAQQIFEDFEAKSNLVGLFNLLLKIDRRVNPHLYNSNSND